MKHVYLVVLSAAVFLGCEKDPGTAGTGTGQTGHRQSLVLPDVSELNAGTTVLNTHQGLEGRSTLTPIAGTYVQLGSDVTMETKPVYPRFASTGAGDYVMFYHYGNSSTWAGNECEMLRSDDLVNWKNYRKLFTATPITDCMGQSNKRGYAGAHPLLLKNGNLFHQRLWGYLKYFQQ